MKNTLLAYIDRFRHDRRERAMLGSVLLVLAIIVTLVVYWQLRLSGVAMTNATYCGYEEHVHTEECYEETLVCGLEETEGHAHTDECYEEQQVIVCGLEESEEHTHDASCYETQLVLVCGLEESEGHMHTDECYEQTLICGLEEHTHTVECLVDLTADVEDATIWEETLPELTGDLRTDVVNIAYSQLGYTESVANYTLGEDGVTHLGYTRYGAWYGNAYSDWDSMFVAFCLEYADISEEFTFNAGAYAWSVDLANLGYYQLAESYSPTAGDILFLDVDSDGKADNTAVVVAVDESLQTVTVIQGNYSVTDGDGNTTDTVALVTYTSPVILGYANLTPEEAVEEVTEEIAEEVIGELAEEIAEEVTESDGEELTASAEEVVETEEGETEANETADEPATVDYVAQVTALYTQAMSLAEGDTEAATTVWDELMAIWEQIYAEEEAGTLALTTEEYDNVNTLTDEAYDYFVNTVGYDPYGVMTPSLTAVESDAKNLVDLLGTSNITWDYSDITLSDGTFTVNYTFNFSGLTYEMATDGNGNAVELVYQLVDISPFGITTNYEYTDSTGSFNYWFCQNDDGSYYIVIKFNDDGLTNLQNAGTTGSSGFISFWSHSVEEDDQGNLYVEVDGDDKVEIEATVVTHDENETWTSDITVSKSSSSYDPENNTITYTVYIYSEQGTWNEIYLNDLLSGLTGLTISGITVDSVQYQQDTDGDGSWNDETYTDVAKVETESEVSDNTGSTYYYTTDPTSTTSNLTIVLSPLEGVDSDLTTVHTYTKGDRYKITYTVTFDPQTSELNTTVYNNATADSYDNVIEDDITSTASSYTSVQTYIVDKSGTYADGEITWTIDFNPYGADVSGYTLTDAKFAAAVADGSLKITNENGDEAVLGVDYTYDNGVITFIANTDTDGDGTADANKYNYTITYTETVSTPSLGTAVEVTNSVTVDDGEGGDVTKSESVTVPSSASGDISKQYNKDGSYEYSDEGVDYIRMSWTSTLTVSKDSIVAGTTITDTLYNDVNYFYSVSQTGQWFSLDDIVRLYASISSATYTINSDNTVYTQGLVFQKDNTVYVIGASDYLVITLDDSGSIATKTEYSDSSEYTDADGNTHYGYFYMEAYDPSTSKWIELTEIEQHNTDYTDTQFTAYRIIFNVDFLDVEGTASITYTSTAYESSVQQSKTFYNTVFVENLKADASHTEYEKVYKTDGYGRDYNSETTTTDGTLTWKVKVYADPNVNYYGSGYYTVTDTLPSRVSFVSATVTADNKSATVTETDTNVALADGYVTGAFGTDSNGNNTLTLTIPYSTFSSLTTKEGNYIEITYTCQIDDFSLMNLSDGDSVGVYENSVSVKYNDTNYGSDEQTQTVTYDDGSSSGGDDLLNKTNTWTSETNTINYKVTFNLDAETLLDGSAGSVLTLTDCAESNVYGGYGSYLTLLESTVKFYELYKLTYDDTTGNYTYTDSKGVTQEYTTNDITEDSNVYTDDDGNHYLKEKLDVAWVYTEEGVTGTGNGTTYHYITAQIPDSTAILFEYSYDVYVLTGNSPPAASGYNTGNLVNTVTVSGGYDENKQHSTVEQYNNAGTEAGLSSSIIIYKTDSENTGVHLEGAGFALYKWDGSEWVKELTLETGSNGKISLAVSDLEYNTAYYLVEEYAPNGYILDSSTKRYFYASNSDTSKYLESYPSGWTDGYGEYAEKVDLSVTSKTYYVGNTAAPTTTLTVTKRGVITVTDEGTGETTTTVENSALSGAVFTLYYYDSTSGWVATEHTYTTGSDGTLTVSATDGYYSYNVAYKLVETAAPDGYSIDDDAVVYFWWYNSSSSLADYPSGWEANYSPINLTTGGGTTTVDNEAVPTISVFVEKAWQSDDGNGTTTALTAAEAGALNYAAKAQLYYYLVKDETNTGGTTTDGVTLYFGGNQYAYGIPTTDLFYVLPVDETVTVTINYVASGWYYLGTQTYISSSWEYKTVSDNGSSANPYIVEFEVSDSYSFYQVYATDSVTISSIKIEYTNDSDVKYTITYDGSDWTTTTSGGSSTPSAGASDVDYYNLTGVTTSSDTQKLGAPYLMDGKEVIVDLTYSGDYKASIDNLPKYMYDSNGDKWYYYYYFVETYAYGSTTDSDGVITSASYSSADGVTGTTSTSDDDPNKNGDENRVITITNKVTQTSSVLLPSTGGAGTKLLYEFGVMLILLSLVGAGTYRNISRIRKSLVKEPHRDGVDPGGTHERLPNVRNRKFVTHRHPRKGDTRAGPDG